MQTPEEVHRQSTSTERMTTQTTPEDFAYRTRENMDPALVQAIHDVNWLLDAYGVKTSHPIRDLRQCSSSLFVILSQRLFSTPLPDIHPNPNTYEKKLDNIVKVFEAVESLLGRPLEHISPHEIVLLNEEHIAYLIAVIRELADHIQAAASQQPGSADLPESLPESEVPQEGEEESNVDSIEATQDLVSQWKEAVVPPAKNNAAQIAEVRRRMKNVQETLSMFDKHYGGKAAGAKVIERPPTPKSQRFIGHVPKPMPKEKRHAHPSGFDMMAALPVPRMDLRMHHVTAHRDATIERLKGQRLLEEASRQLRSGLAAQESLAEASMADFGRKVAKQQRRDLADLKKFVRDEDRIQREAFAELIEAKKQRMITKAKLAKDEMYYDPATNRRRRHRDISSIGMDGHISDTRPTDVVLLAKRALAEYAIVSQVDLASEYQRYRDSVGGWRATAIPTR